MAALGLQTVTATFHVGDAIEVMGKLPEKSVDLILTSPPFLALRSYLPADHPDKALEGGSQATPGAFIDWLIDVVEACDRVLAPHGSMCIELGDTYAGNDGGGDAALSYRMAINGERDKGGQSPTRGRSGWPLAKSLSLIPELFRLTLVYGTNPLTGRQTERWRLRNVVRWVRPNPPVGALGDKFRPATSELMVFCKSAKRYFDLDAVREPHKIESPSDATRHLRGYNVKVHPDIEHRHDSGRITHPLNPAGAPPLDWWNIPHADMPIGERVWWCTKHNGSGLPEAGACDIAVALSSDPIREGCDFIERLLAPMNIPLLAGEKETRQPATKKITSKAPSGISKGSDQGERQTWRTEGGAPPLDWWNIPPGGYEGAHYAVFPPELCIKPIKAMSPERVCKVCGEPSRRITKPTEAYAGFLGASFHDHQFDDERGNAKRGDSGAPADLRSMGRGGLTRQVETTGFSDCGHNDWRSGVVLDPFVGSGTTLMVATGHGRNAIGIDLDARNFDLALNRVGPFILERGVV